MNFDAGKNGSYQKYFGKEHEMMRKAIREFVSKEVKPNINDWEEQGEFPRDMYKKASVLLLFDYSDSYDINTLYVSV